MRRIFQISERPNASAISGPVLIAWQRVKGNYLVTAGGDPVVSIYDRHGDQVHIINTPGIPIAIEWDSDGEMLAIITDRSPVLILWNSSSYKTSQVDSGMHDPLCPLLLWSQSSGHSNQILALCSVKGSLLIYNNRTSRKVPVLSKHVKRITTGAWSPERAWIALAGEDNVLSISNDEGDTIAHIQIKGEPSMLQFTCIAGGPDQRALSGNMGGSQNSISLVLNKCAIFALDIRATETPLTFNFQEHYGHIVGYGWTHDSTRVLVGFQSGYFVLMAASGPSRGSEILSTRGHMDRMLALDFCYAKKQLVSSAENVIKVHDLNNVDNIIAIQGVDEESEIRRMKWSSDGSLLAVVSPSGSVHVFLTHLSLLGDTYGPRIGFLSSLLEITVLNLDSDFDIALDSALEPNHPITIRLDVEPNCVAVGPQHVAVSMNNRAWYYTVHDGGNIMVREREYVAILKEIKLNSDFSAVRFADGRLQLHPIESESAAKNVKVANISNKSDSKMFLDADKITCHALTPELLIFGTETGSVEFFSLEDWTTVNVYRHEASGGNQKSGIRFIYPDLQGTRVLIVDSSNEVYLYTTLSDLAIQLDASTQFPVGIKRLIWDSWPLDRSVFLALDSKTIYILSYSPDTIDGSRIDLVGKQKIPQSMSPLLLYNGLVVCQTHSGKTSNFLLESHDYGDKLMQFGGGGEPEKLLRTEYLPKLLKIHRFTDVWRICEEFDTHDPVWNSFLDAAVFNLNLDLGIKIARHRGHAALVDELERIYFPSLFEGGREERNLVAAHCAVILKQYELAQQLFLSSSSPHEALMMRASILDWDEALRLARRLAPERVPSLSLECATQLEYMGDHALALVNFEQALLDRDNLQELGLDKGRLLLTASQIETHNRKCMAGIARNSFRTGNVRRGMEFALAINQENNNNATKSEEWRSFFNDCAAILEGQKLYTDAAQLYMRATNFDAAAELYLKARDTTKVSEIIDHVTKPEIWAQYGREKEKESKFKESIRAYTKGNDWVSVIRIQLDKLNNPDEAVRLVREQSKNGSVDAIEGAKMVARWFQRLNDMNSAIEFLVLSQATEEAYRLAQASGQIDLYANSLLAMDESQRKRKMSQPNDNQAPLIKQDDFRSLAMHFEADRNWLRAGQLFIKGGEAKKGIKFLLQAASSATINTPASDNPDNPDEIVAEAIRLLTESGPVIKDDPPLLRQVIDFLLGENDGIPKDFKYLFRFYMALRMYREAARTALIIAREEQNSGNYRNAHDLLYGMCSELRKNSIRIPNEMYHALCLVHTYLLAKSWSKAGDHERAALALVRVVNNISKFPAHTVPILTSAVIECQRAGFKRAAFQYATQLLKSEYKAQMDPKMKHKIETLVRKSAGSIQSNDGASEEQVLGDETECPHCNVPVPEMELICPACRNQIPYCIATGSHLTRSNLTRCSSCKFPALASHLSSLLAAAGDESERLCPMCGRVQSIEQLTTLDEMEVNQILKQFHSGDK